MQKLLSILDKVPEFENLLSQIDAVRCPVALSGLSAVHRAHFAAALQDRKSVV